MLQVSEGSTKLCKRKCSQRVSSASEAESLRLSLLAFVGHTSTPLLSHLNALTFSLFFSCCCAHPFPARKEACAQQREVAWVEAVGERLCGGLGQLTCPPLASRLSSRCSKPFSSSVCGCPLRPPSNSAPVFMSVRVLRTCLQGCLCECMPEYSNLRASTTPHPWVLLPACA